MNLQDKLFHSNILIPMHATNKEEAIQELLNHLQSLKILSSTVQLFANINEQESAFTSSAGRGMAFPHSTSIEVSELTCILGISKNGIDFDSPDGHDCHLILLTLSPKDDPKEHRKFITRFRSMVQNSEIRFSLYEADSNQEIISIISNWEENDNIQGALI